MTKRKNKNSQLISLITIIISVVIIAMLFIDGIKVNFTENSSSTYKLYQAIFGYKSTLLSFGGTKVTTQVFKFSFVALIPFILTFLALILSFVNLGNGKKKKALDFLILLLFLASAILLFLIPNFIVLGKSYNYIKASNIKIQVGVIISGALSIFGVLLEGYALIK